MKVVLRHKSTGRYYRAPDEWVRRADNALAFDDVTSAQDFLRVHQLNETQTVYRLAPYLMPLLQSSPQSMWETWAQAQSRWDPPQANKFNRN